MSKLTLFSYLSNLVNQGNTRDTCVWILAGNWQKAKMPNCWRLQSVLRVAGWVTPPERVMERLKANDAGRLQAVSILRINWMSQKDPCF